MRNGGFTLNYVKEDVRYLGIPQLDVIAFPMLCFCDIPAVPSRIKTHEDNYGEYGIGLSKAWGRSVGVQPVHYLVPGSPFVEDLQSSFKLASELDGSDAPMANRSISDFLVTVLAYAKPVWGRNKKGDGYCFEDECEWRYVPRNLGELPTFIPSPTEGMLTTYCLTIRRPETYLLKFEYGDIDSILVPTDADIRYFLGVINELDVDEDERDLLKTKLRRS